MNKYFAIINNKTLAVIILCIAVTFCCYSFNFSYDLNIFVFSIAILFPLVFTIREAFKRRDSALKFLSSFKASMNGLYYCFENNNKLQSKDKIKVYEELNSLSIRFMTDLKQPGKNLDDARAQPNEIFIFIQSNPKSISLGTSMKIFRFLQDIHESIENIFSLKMHDTPVSLIAYCLVFIFIFPVIFTPPIAYSLSTSPPLVVYFISILHGFILISLYNLQEDIENPFDQIGLDDIRLEEFQFSQLNGSSKGNNETIS